MCTTRLSSVMTGCPLKATTCSRRSIEGLTRSTNGMMKFIPGSSVLRYRPNRSTLRARAWGTMRTVLVTISATSATITTATIRTASSTATPGDRRGLSHPRSASTSGRVHGTLISVGLIEHRPGVGTFVLGPPPDGEQEIPALAAAAQEVVDAFDEWRARAKPRALADAVSKLRDALR